MSHTPTSPKLNVKDKLGNKNQVANNVASDVTKKVAKEIAHEVIRGSVRNSMREVNKEKTISLQEIAKKIGNDVSKIVVNAAVKKAINESEIAKKYPPAPQRVQELSQPRKASYIALYNKYRDILNPVAVAKIEEKISDYLKTIEEKRKDDKLTEEVQKVKRKDRKVPKKEQISHEFEKFCNDQCDNVFQIFSDKFTKSIHSRELPKPLIMGGNSRVMYEKIKSRILDLIKPTTDESMETVQKLSYFIMEFVKNVAIEALTAETNSTN